MYRAVMYTWNSVTMVTTGTNDPAKSTRWRQHLRTVPLVVTNVDRLVMMEAKAEKVGISMLPKILIVMLPSVERVVMLRRRTKKDRVFQTSWASSLPFSLHRWLTVCWKSPTFCNERMAYVKTEALDKLHCFWLVLLLFKSYQIPFTQSRHLGGSVQWGYCGVHSQEFNVCKIQPQGVCENIRPLHPGR